MELFMVLVNKYTIHMKFRSSACQTFHSNALSLSHQETLNSSLPLFTGPVFDQNVWFLITMRSDENQSLRIESFAIMNLRSVSTKLHQYCIRHANAQRIYYISSCIFLIVCCGLQFLRKACIKLNILNLHS